MPRWLRVIRGMVGTGLTFALGVGVLGSVLGLVGVLVGAVSWDVLRLVARLSVVAGIVGVAFSAGLAVLARSRTFDRLSLPFVIALGAGGGLLYFLFLAAMNGARVWSLSTAIANLTILTFLGAGAAAGTLIIARKAQATLTSGKDAARLGVASPDAPKERRGSAG